MRGYGAGWIFTCRVDEVIRRTSVSGPKRLGIVLFSQRVYLNCLFVLAVPHFIASNACCIRNNIGREWVNMPVVNHEYEPVPNFLDQIQRFTMR